MSDMSDLRPSLAYGQVRCAKCGEACNFMSTGLHNARRQYTASGAGVSNGYILIEAKCHGEMENGIVTFAAMRADPDRILEFFHPPGTYALNDEGALLLDSIESNPISKAPGKVIDVDVEASVLPSCFLPSPPTSGEPR